MKTTFLFIVFFFVNFVAFGQAKVNLESLEDIKNWVTHHKFNSEEAFGYTISIETVNNVQMLIFASQDGQKKQFTNVQYTTGATSAMVSGQGEANNSLEVMVLENGDLSLAGMVFKAEE